MRPVGLSISRRRQRLRVRVSKNRCGCAVESWEDGCLFEAWVTVVLGGLNCGDVGYPIVLVFVAPFPIYFPRRVKDPPSGLIEQARRCGGPSSFWGLHHDASQSKRPYSPDVAPGVRRKA